MSTSIEWTDTTWNPTVGCSRVSPGCQHCYAELMAARIANAAQARLRDGTRELTPKQSAYLRVVRWKLGGKTRSSDLDVALPRWNGCVALDPESLAEPLRWRKPRRCFVNSMSDLFHEGLSFEEIAAVFGVMAACPHITFQVLTKRPGRVVGFCKWLGRATQGWSNKIRADFLTDHAIQHREVWDLFKSNNPTWPLPNLWLGVSAENQETLMERAPELEKCPAVIRFLSLEPLLGPIDLGRVLTYIDWVIAGGESGPGARPCDIAWLRSVRDQCKVAGVPVFLKQLGSQPYANPNLELGMSEDDLFLPLKSRKGGDWSEWPEDLKVREFPEVAP